MSLLDDVSIVVTPNGYKAGELYAVIPVPTEGAELVTNGDFASDLTGWATYGTTSATGGIATIGASANSGIYQGVLTQGVRYTVTFNVTSYNGVGTAQFVSDDGANLYTITETGVQTFTFTSDIAAPYLYIRGLSNALFSLSSVSVKEYTSADMDVTRATAATRVDENGLVNYAEVIGGEEVTCGDFSCAVPTDYWTENGWTINGEASNDGVNTGNLNQDIGLQQDKTYLVEVTITNYNSGTLQVRLGLGATIDVGSSEDTFSLTLTSTSTNSLLRFYPKVGSLFNGSISNVSVKEVTRDNVPRIDYTGGGCPHILAEPQRTNLVTESEDFTTWSIARATLGTNITAPNGEADGYSIIATAVNDDHFVYKSISVVNTTVYTYSAYLKKGSKSWARLWNTSVGYADFDLENGVVGTQSSVVGSIDLLNNGWYRCSIVYTAVSTGNDSHRIYTLDGDNDKTFLGDGSTINLYTFGAQLEEGSYATSYIPTSGSTVTRNQDIFTRDGIGSLINSTEGVLFVEIALLIDDDSNKYITLTDTIGENTVQIDFDYSSSRLQYVVLSGTVVQCNIKVSYSGVSMDKFALKWKENDFAIWLNGVEIGTDTLGSSPIGLNTLKFSSPSGSNNFFGKVKQLQVYDTALTDVQLAALTS